MDLECRDIYFRLLHNKLSTRERLFVYKKAKNPYCLKESVSRILFGPLEYGVRSFENLIVGGATDDVLHTFCACRKVSYLWRWMRGTVLRFLPARWSSLSNQEILYLMWPCLEHDQTVVWLLSQYTQYVWTHGRDSMADFKLDPFIGYLESRYVAHVTSNRLPLSDIVVFDPG